MELFEAASRNDTEKIHQLIKQGVDLETRDSQNRTPLMRATYENNLEAATLLIEAGANVNALDDRLDPPLPSCGSDGIYRNP